MEDKRIGSAKEFACELMQCDSVWLIVKFGKFDETMPIEASKKQREELMDWARERIRNGDDIEGKILIRDGKRILRVG